MSPRRPSCRGLAWFVTGTDTGVGKTVVAAALLRALAASGRLAVGMKPVAAGAVRAGGRWVNEDVEMLAGAGNLAAPAAWLNPYLFHPPIAPHIAASEARRTISAARIERAYRALARRADAVVIEGAGGFCVPLGRRLSYADVAERLGLPVLLVVGMRLGCINHALLTAEAVRSRGLRLAGWIANHIDRTMARKDENVRAIAERIRAPLLARLPYSARPDPGRLAARFNLDAIVDER